MYKILRCIRTELPADLPELAQLGRRLWTRWADILVYFDISVYYGSTEAVDGRFELFRWTAQGFGNFDHFHLVVSTVSSPNESAHSNYEGPARKSARYAWR
ncbi:transposase [Gordonia phosphorivorans]